MIFLVSFLLMVDYKCLDSSKKDGDKV